MKTKRLIIGAIVVAAVAAACYFLTSSAPSKGVALETAKVKKDSISNIVTSTGTVEPITQVEVGTQVSGIISKIYVDYNSVVKKGQLIAELEKTLLESELASQKATLASGKTEYEYQKKNYDRAVQLYQKQLISDTEYENDVYLYEKAKNAYEKSQADLVRAVTNLNYAMIYSPIDGVVISRAVDEGQTVAASFNTPTLFTIANDLTKMQVIANVDEADIGQIALGQRVSFIVDAFPNDVFQGEVLQIRLEATTTSNVVTYEVVVNAPNPDLKLKPGLTANISIYALEKNNILTVPAKALRFMPDEALTGDGAKIVAETAAAQDDLTKHVWVRDGEGLREVPVKVGITSGSATEIVEGLQEGEVVIVGMAAPGLKAAASGEKGTGESSPFMPKRPERNKK